jgi:protein kinase C substrate 80K-H
MARLAGLAALALVALAGAAAAGPVPRGVDPALADRYSGAGGSFVCLDGSKTVPFARVNDDYCDCPDGSDEPGEAPDRPRSP